MSPSADAAANTLDEAAHLATAGCSPAESSALGSFVRGFHRNVPPAELGARSPEVLAQTALEMWRFAQSRTSGEPKIDIRPNGPNRGVILLLNDDRRFLVDSVCAALSGLGLDVDLVVHPVMRVERDVAGQLTACWPEATTGALESMMRIEATGDLGAERGAAIVARLASVLADVCAAVEDWPAMRARVRIIAEDVAR